MITQDPETLCRFLGLEFAEDLGQVVPKIAPPRRAPRPELKQIDNIIRFGSSLRPPGLAANSLKTCTY